MTESSAPSGSPAPADPRETLAAAVALVTDQTRARSGDDWSRPSPCDGWDARDVLVHVTGTLRKVVAMLDSGTYAGAPSPTDGSVAPEDAVAAWHEARSALTAALADADLQRVVATPRGELPAAQGLLLPTADCAVHAWDIAASAGAPLELPEPLLRLVDGMSRSIPEEQLRGGMFGPRQEAPEGASATEQLMAWLGRRRPTPLA